MSRMGPGSRDPDRITLLWRLGVAALVGVIVWASLTPHPLENGLDHGDKLNHLFGYGSVMFWAAQLPAPRWRLAAGFVGLGILMETLQALTGYRQADIYDALANSAGVGVGWLLASALPNLRERLAARWASRDSRL